VEELKECLVRELPESDLTAADFLLAMKTLNKNGDTEITFDEYTDVFEIAIESQKIDDNFVTDEVNE
jgi:hypothetical protein